MERIKGEAMLKQEQTPWSEGIVLICTKCAKAIPASSLREEGNAAENLKIYLKKNLKETGDHSKIRVVTSSCLDVCEDGLQAVTYSGIHGETQTMTLHPEQDRDQILSFIKSKID